MKNIIKSKLRRQSPLVIAILWLPVLSNAQMYMIQTLKLEDEITSAISINNTGHVLVNGTTQTEGKTYLFTNAQFQELTGLGGQETHGTDLNDRDIAVGYATDSNSDIARAVIFYEDSTFDLSNLLPDRPRSIARGINNHGHVVGYFYQTDGNQRAFYYDGTEAMDLGISPSGIAEAINDLGQIVGFERDSQNWLSGYIWESGTRTLIPSLGGIRTSVQAVNNNGLIAGNSQLIPNVSGHAFIFETGNPALTDLGTLRFSSQVFDANYFGEVVGINQNEDSSVNEAFVYKDGSMLNLNEQIEEGSGWSLEFAYSINEFGVICGQGVLNGVKTAFVLTPSSNAGIEMYAGISVVGEPGQSYRIEYRDTVGDESNWNRLGEITLNSTSEIYFDYQSPFNPRRFYQVIKVE